MQSSFQKTFSHYYGDFVRIIFIVAAVFMLWGLPRITELFGVPVLLPIAAIAVLGIAAGITNPVRLQSLKINVVVSVVFLIIFAYLSWYSYTNSLGGIIEFSNQVGAILFLFASYFSIKSFRGAVVTE